MAYFTPEFSRFFRHLARNNRRPWYHAHKAEYETHVKVPFGLFVEEMIERIAALDPGMRCEAHAATFRLARDTRFSKDKTPYKTVASAVIGPGGRKSPLPGFYFQFGADGLGLAGGAYQPDRDALFGIRRAIRDDGATLNRLLRNRAFKRLFGSLQGDRNVRLPPEFAAAADEFPLLFNKQFYYWREYEAPDLLLRRDLGEFLMRHYRAGRAINAWLTRAMT